MNVIMRNLIDELAERAYNDTEFESTEELREASQKAYSLYWNDARFSDVRSKMESAIGLLELLNEHIGFVAGFKCAVEMLCKTAEDKNAPATDQSTQGANHNQNQYTTGGAKCQSN